MKMELKVKIRRQGQTAIPALHAVGRNITRKSFPARNPITQQPPFLITGTAENVFVPLYDAGTFVMAIGVSVMKFPDNTGELQLNDIPACEALVM